MCKNKSMKTFRHLRFVLFLLVASLLLSACGSAAQSGWSGVNVDQERVYLSAGTQVYAINLANGNQVWSFPEKADKRAFNAPAAITSDGQVIVGDYTNTLYSLNAATGQQNWAFDKAKGQFVGEALVTDEAIYAPSGDYHLYALNLKGALLWSFEAQNALWARPVIKDNTVFVSSLDHSLYALDATTGKKLWSTVLDGAIPGAPALSDEGVLYVGTLAKEMFAVDSTSGKILWRISTDHGIWSGPAIKEGALYFGDLGGYFYKVEMADGKVQWKMPYDNAIVGTPSVTESGIVFATEKGSLYLVDTNGNQIWQKTFEGGLYTSPIVAMDRLILPLTNSKTLLMSLDSNGNTQWSFIPSK
jgi:outer membrane protein assembly factor BamB